MNFPSSNTSLIDTRIVFVARVLRLFSYGSLATIFVAFMMENKNLSTYKIQWMEFFIATGDMLISLLISMVSVNIGRKKTLIFASLLKAFTSLIYVYSQNVYLLLLTGVFGILSITGN